MKKNLTSKTFTIIGLLLLFSSFAFAQDTTRTADPSLKGQYLFILGKSKNFQGYKLINPARLASFWNSVSDTVRISKTQLIQAERKIKEQQNNINTLKNEVSGKESSLANSNAMVNEIKFLGISFNKSTYNTLVWSLILALGAALAFVITQSARYRHEAKYRVKLFEELSEEHQAYKVKANDKEKKLARELQDERNKLDELRRK